MGNLHLMPTMSNSFDTLTTTANLLPASITVRGHLHPGRRIRTGPIPMVSNQLRRLLRPLQLQHPPLQHLSHLVTQMFEKRVVGQCQTYLRG